MRVFFRDRRRRVFPENILPKTFALVINQGGNETRCRTLPARHCSRLRIRGERNNGEAESVRTRILFRFL